MLSKVILLALLGAAAAKTLAFGGVTDFGYAELDTHLSDNAVDDAEASCPVGHSDASATTDIKEHFDFKTAMGAQNWKGDVGVSTASMKTFSVYGCKGCATESVEWTTQAKVLVPDSACGSNQCDTSTKKCKRAKRKCVKTQRRCTAYKKVKQRYNCRWTSRGRKCRTRTVTVCKRYQNICTRYQSEYIACNSKMVDVDNTVLTGICDVVRPLSGEEKNNAMWRVSGTALNNQLAKHHSKAGSASDSKPFCSLETKDKFKFEGQECMAEVRLIEKGDLEIKDKTCIGILTAAGTVTRKCAAGNFNAKTIETEWFSGSEEFSVELAAMTDHPTEKIYHDDVKITCRRCNTCSVTCSIDSETGILAVLHDTTSGHSQHKCFKTDEDSCKCECM